MFIRWLHLDKVSKHSKLVTKACFLLSASSSFLCSFSSSISFFLPRICIYFSYSIKWFPIYIMEIYNCPKRINTSTNSYKLPITHLRVQYAFINTLPWKGSNKSNILSTIKHKSRLQIYLAVRTVCTMFVGDNRYYSSSIPAQLSSRCEETDSEQLADSN